MVLEWTNVQLLEGVVKWIQCHCLASLEEAIQLVEDNVVAFLGVDELPSPPFPFISLPFPSVIHRLAG